MTFQVNNKYFFIWSPQFTVEATFLCNLPLYTFCTCKYSVKWPESVQTVLGYKYTVYCHWLQLICYWWLRRWTTRRTAWLRCRSSPRWPPASPWSPSPSLSSRFVHHNYSYCRFIVFRSIVHFDLILSIKHCRNPQITSEPAILQHEIIHKVNFYQNHAGTDILLCIVLILPPLSARNMHAESCYIFYYFV